MDSERAKFLNTCLTYGLLVAAVLGLFGGVLAVRIVDAGESCAVVRLGEVVGTLREGLHFVTPLVTSIKCFPIRTIIYETSDQPDESRADWTDWTVNANTSDGQQISITFGVGFHVEPQDAEFVYSHVASSTFEIVERVVKFNSRSVVRKVAQQFTAGSLYTGDIFGFELAIRAQLDALFEASGITLDNFAVRKIAFDPDYVAAIEQQQIARENIETANFQAQSAQYEA